MKEQDRSTSETKTRTAKGYCRCSTDKQDLTRQHRLIENYCRQEEIELKYPFIEEKISGAAEERKSFEIASNLTKEDCDVLIVSEISRLSREEDLSGIMTFMTNTIKKGIDVYFVSTDTLYKGGTTLNPIQWIQIILESFAASDERKKIAKRMQSGKDSKISSYPNMMCGGNPNFGYKISENPDYVQGKTPRHIMTINETTAPILKQIFLDLTSGISLIKICDALNRQGIKTQHSKNWEQSALSEIIRNPIYKGKRMYNNRSYDVECLRIVDDETWTQANNIITNNQKRRQGYNKVDNELFGLIYCGICKRRLYMMYNKGQRVYKCAANAVRQMKEHKHTGFGINKEDLILIVKEDAKDILNNDKESFYYQRNKRIEQINRENENLTKEIKTLREETKDKLLKKIEKYTDLLGDTTDDYLSRSYKKKLEETADELHSIDEKIETLKDTINKNNILLNDLIQEARIIRNDEIKSLLNTMIDKIYWTGYNALSGKCTIIYKSGITSTIWIKRNTKIKETDLFVLRSYVKELDKKKITEIIENEENTFNDKLLIGHLLEFLDWIENNNITENSTTKDIFNALKQYKGIMIGHMKMKNNKYILTYRTISYYKSIYEKLKK